MRTPIIKFKFGTVFMVILFTFKEYVFILGYQSMTSLPTKPQNLSIRTALLES